LHALQLSNTAITPDLGNTAVAQVVDGTFHPGRQLPDVMALAREIVSPVLAVGLHELRHDAILSRDRGDPASMDGAACGRLRLAAYPSPGGRIAASCRSRWGCVGGRHRRTSRHR